MNDGLVNKMMFRKSNNFEQNEKFKLDKNNESQG